MHLTTPTNTISNIPTSRFEVKGEPGTQNLPAEAPVPAPAPAKAKSNE